MMIFSVGRFVYWWGWAVWALMTEWCILCCTCFPFVIIGLSLAIVTGILAPLCTAIASILCGPTAAVTAYNKGFKASFVFMFNAITDANQQYWKFVFEEKIPERFFFWCDW